MKMIWLPSGCEDKMFYLFFLGEKQTLSCLTLQQYRLRVDDKSEFLISQSVTSFFHVKISGSMKEIIYQGRSTYDFLPRIVLSKLIDYDMYSELRKTHMICWVGRRVDKIYNNNSFLLKAKDLITS